LLRLPVPVREALVLRYYEDMSFEDIASVTGDTLSSVKMKVYRGLEKIRLMMVTDGITASE
jgi:RNA polymerase sigma-70 factor (ECF subfamily)